MYGKRVYFSSPASRLLMCSILFFALLAPVAAEDLVSELTEILTTLEQGLQKVETGLTQSETALMKVESGLNSVERGLEKSETALTDLKASFAEYKKQAEARERRLIAALVVTFALAILGAVT